MQGSYVHRVEYKGKLLIFVVKTSLSLTLSRPVPLRIIKKRINLVYNVFEMMTNDKCCSSLLTVVGDHPVVGSGYLPHNISDETIFVLLY